jgi:hypothetical protein
MALRLRPPAILLVGHMVADRASDHRSRDRMPVREVSGDPADDCTLQTTARLGCARGGRDRQCKD